MLWIEPDFTIGVIFQNKYAVLAAQIHSLLSSFSRPYFSRRIGERGVNIDQFWTMQLELFLQRLRQHAVIITGYAVRFSLIGMNDLQSSEVGW
ncbi:hypothetical protein D3C74_414940 [compost metagenome]